MLPARRRGRFGCNNRSCRPNSAVKDVVNGDSAVCGSEDERTLGAGNVGAGVGTNFASNGVNTVAKLRGNCSCDRKLPLQSVCWGAGAVRGHKFTTTLGNAAGQFLGLANINGGVLRVEKLFVERN